MSNIAEIIKYEGDNSTFIWKHPCEDFNSLTQLIVHESQEAIFFMNGQALDLFGAGRYTLETQNIPMIGKVLNRATGDKSPFHCEVYFINKTETDLCSIFNRSIIPLLYEYFYDNSTKVKAQVKNALPSDQYEITGGTVGRIKISKK